jgi:SAM-dependent methyltransferase
MMRSGILPLFWCPRCHGDLECHATESAGERVREGELRCTGCDAAFPIRNSIPRFVDNQSYASSFGKQWNAFAKAQIDGEAYGESAVRFDSEIGWDEAMLEGSTIVEVGSGAGRFVDVLAKRRPRLVIGMDITDAVDAAARNVTYDNVQFVQGDAFASPIRDGVMDFAYSIGVLHHTPDPRAAFDRMVDMVRSDGYVGVSLYEISLYRRPNRNSFRVMTMELLWALNLWRCELFRTVTTRVPHGVMIAYCKTVIPVLHVLNKIPVLRLARYGLPSTCYPNLPVVWSMVDTMDTYSTRIVHQYRAKDVFQWFRALGLREITLMNSRPGWVSIVAEKGPPEDRARRQASQRQPLGPGLTGYLDPEPAGS